MDPSVLLKSTWRPQWPDPVEDRKKLLTLRDLMDQRRIREQQYQMHQLAMQKTQQEMADEQRTRQILSTSQIPEHASLTDLTKLGLDFDTSVKILNNQRLLGTATATQKTAELTQQKAEADLAKRKQQDIADVYYGIRGRPVAGASGQPTLQPATDEAIMMDLLKPEGQRLGLGKIGQETPLALTEPQFQAKYSEAYTPVQTQALLKGEADARAADLKTDEERFKAVYPLIAGASDQEAWTAAIKTAPIQYQRLFSPRFSTENKQRALSMWVPAGEQARLGALDDPEKILVRMNDPATPAAEIPRLKELYNQMVAYHLAIRPGTGGADISGIVEAVKKNPEYFAGLPADTKAAILPALSAAGFNPPPPGDFLNKAEALTRVRKALAEYRTHLKSYSPWMRAGTPEHATLTGAYRDLQIEMKEAAQLGALTGPDMGLLTEMAQDPTSLMGRYSGKDTLDAQMGQYEKSLNNKEQSLYETYKQQAPQRGTAPSGSATKTAGPAGAPKTAAEAQAAGWVPVKKKDGKTAWFPNKAEADAFQKRGGGL